VQRKIIAGAYSFPDRYWGAVSHEAKDLVAQLLQVDPARRFTVAQSLAHPWIQQHGVSTGPLPRANAELFRSFNNK
jgi:serine/threonine protein kinase